jgi:uncharacterized RDD family membrane protein YckC
VSTAEFHGERAGIVTRSIACAVDAAVVTLLLVIVWAGAAAVLFLVHPHGFSFPSPSFLVVMMAGCGLSVVYLASGWATSGRTAGAQLLGLRVVDRESRRLGWVRSLVRAALYVCFPVGLVWAAVDPWRRSVQDLLAGSIVVYDWRPRRPTGPETAVRVEPGT